MGSSYSQPGRDSISETETHNKEFGTRHVSEQSLGFHPSLIELHAPSAGIGILLIVGFVCLAAALYKGVTAYCRHRGRHRALRHYYHTSECQNFAAPLYPPEPHFEDYLNARRKFVTCERPAHREIVHDRPTSPNIQDEMNLEITEV